MKQYDDEQAELEAKMETMKKEPSSSAIIMQTELLKQ